MTRLIKTMLLLISMLFLFQAKALAEEPTSYRPPTATFSGKGALILPAANALNINGAGTIEFWVSAQWQDNLDYDPAILAYTGENGPRFAIHMAANARGIAIYAGDYYEGVQYDFSDGALHYVAILNTGDFIDIYIDGTFQKSLPYGFADLTATTFSIGSYAKQAAFIGEIGQVRIWDEPIDQDTLNKYSLMPLLAEGEGAHPDIESLVAMSTFGNPESNGFMIIQAPEEPNLTTPIDTYFDDGEIPDLDSQ